MEDSDSIGRSLWEDCALICTKRGLESGKIVGGDVEHAVVISYEEVKHGVACTGGYAFNKLIDEWWNCCIVNCDGIEGLEIMDNVQGAILLFDAEPA